MKRFTFRQTKLAGAVVLIAILFFSFQNCSKTNFTGVQDEFASLKNIQCTGASTDPNCNGQFVPGEPEVIVEAQPVEELPQIMAPVLAEPSPAAAAPVAESSLPVPTSAQPVATGTASVAAAPVVIPKPVVKSQSLIVPNKAVTPKPPVKILMIIDNSYSMSQSVAQVTANIDSMLLPLKGLNVDVKIISTSEEKSVKYEGLNPATGATEQINQNLFDDYNKNATEWTRIRSVTRKTTFDSEPKGQVFNLRSTHSQAIVDRTVLNIKSAILRLSINGDSEEKSFCPILRSVKNAADNNSTSFFKKGDSIAILVLTDEEDSSNFKNCLIEEKITRVYSEPRKENIGYSGLGNPAQYEYRASQSLITYTIPKSVDYPAVYENIDGVNKLVQPATTRTIEDRKSIYTSSCSDIPTSVTSIPGYVFTSCNVYPTGKLLGTSATKGDLCTTTYKDYPDCTVKYEAAQAATYATKNVWDLQKEDTNNSPLVNTVDASNFASLDLLTLGQIKQQFGENYFISFISHKTGNRLQSGQSIAKSFEALVAREPQKIKIYSILERSYAPALKQVSDFVGSFVFEKYALDLLPGTQVKEVYLERLLATAYSNKGGSSPTYSSKEILDPSKYNLLAGFIEIKMPLAAGDKLTVKYTEPEIVETTAAMEPVAASSADEAQ